MSHNNCCATLKYGLKQGRLGVLGFCVDSLKIEKETGARKNQIKQGHRMSSKRFYFV